MSQKTDMQNVAKNTILSVTGTPPDQLRGLTVQAFDSFVSRTASIPLTAVNPTPPPEVKSTSLSFPQSALPTNEQPMPTQMNSDGGGGTPAGGTLVARYTDVSTGTPTAATGTFLTP